MPERRIFISGYYGYANTGDEAILSAMLAGLRARAPDARFTVVSGSAAETAAAHGVDAVAWNDPHAIAEAVRAADLVITGGGGIFHDYGGFSEGGLFTEGNWGIGFHVTAGLLAGLYGKPHIIHAVGVGPLLSERARRYVRAVCETAAAITVRDEGSARLLGEIGVEAERVVLTADPAFLFPVQTGVVDAQPVIGVAVRHWSHEVERDRWESATARGLDLFLERHPEIVSALFVPFQRLDGEQEDDVAAARRIIARMSRPARIAEDAHTPQQVAALLAGCRIVLGMRLHALIFSWKARVPFVALAYDAKVDELLRRAGDSDRLTLAGLTAESLAARLDAALDERPPDPEPLIALARRNTDLACKLLDERTVRPLAGEALAAVREAVGALLASNKQLRGWLDERKINYEFLISQLEAQAASLSASLAESGRERDNLTATLEETKQRLEETKQRLAESTEREAVLAGNLSTAQATSAQRRQWLDEWKAYGAAMEQRLSVYRGLRSWRGMLAMRRAHTLLTRQGWSGRLRFPLWLLSLIAGSPNLESEQLEFPPKPKQPE